MYFPAEEAEAIPTVLDGSAFLIVITVSAVICASAMLLSAWTVERQSLKPNGFVNNGRH